MTTTDPATPLQVAALYRFARFTDCDGIACSLRQLCSELSIKGTLLVAPEGINGTVAGSATAIANLVTRVRALPGCDELEVKYSVAATMPFHRLKVRVKREIVTLGQPGIDPLVDAGTYVDPADWNALIDDPDTIVIDTRNDYEVAIGSFASAIDPKTARFRDFPAWFSAQRDTILGAGKQPKVAMYCTGGIRCEKATAFLKREGVEDVFHLKGGILAYLETVPSELSRWQGECFVFDQRVAVGQGLAPGSFKLCFACRRPVSPADERSPLFEEGVTCAACHSERTDTQRAAYRERHRQEQRAAAAGRSHVGAVLPGSDLSRDG